MFLFNRGDITDRLDPKFLKYTKSETLFKYPARRLGKLLLKAPEYGAGEPGMERTDAGQVRYIRITDINNFGLLHDGLGATVEVASPRYLLHDQDLLIARSGNTVGKTYLHRINDVPEQSIFAGYLIRFVLNKLEALPEYVFTLTQLPLYKDWIDAIQRPSGQPNINAEEYRSWHLPVPPLEQQIEIVSRMQQAYATFILKEQAAQALLSGLDAYLLKELEVELPLLETQEKLFYSSWQNLTGKRLDPKKYANFATALEKAISSSSLPHFPLSELITHQATGDWGFDEDDSQVNTNYRRCLVIRATEFDNLYNLRLQNDRVKYRLLDQFRLARLDVLPYDLLLEKSGGSPDQPVGRVALLTPDLFDGNQLAYSNFVQKFRVDTTRALPAYIFNFLKTMHNIKRTDAMQSQTNGIRNLIGWEYFSQKIILPSIEIQERIANHMDTVRNQAKLSAEQAETDFAAAKAEIERLILA